MDYEKLHKDTIAKLQEMVNSGKITAETARGICADFVPELEDERIIKAIKSAVLQLTDIYLQEKYGLKQSDCIDWLDKQGEHANFRNKIQIGDKVTRNEDGVLVNLSQLKRVAKKDEKQGEQKPAWSEEDENNINSIVSRLEVDISYWESRSKTRTNEDKKLIEWLKSLKSQNTWKPSDEQMEGLECTIKTLKYQLNAGDNRLNSLYNDLKKLKEE